MMIMLEENAGMVVALSLLAAYILMYIVGCLMIKRRESKIRESPYNHMECFKLIGISEHDELAIYTVMYKQLSTEKMSLIKVPIELSEIKYVKEEKDERLEVIKPYYISLGEKIFSKAQMIYKLYVLEGRI